MTVKKILLVAVVCLFSCSSKKNIPKGILQPAKMQLVLFDVLRADNFVTEYVKKDSAKKPEEEIAKLQRQIFAVHKISKEDFYKSFDFYKAHPDMMQPMLDSMISSTNRNKYQNTFGKPKPPKDSLKVN
jgi:hypothetical protein